MSTFKRATEGEALRITANAWNASLDAAEAFRRDGRRRGGGSLAGSEDNHSLIVRVKNDTGRDIWKGFCCWISQDETDIQYEQNIYEANQSPTFKAIFRSNVDTQKLNAQFGVAIEPISKGEYGRVCIRGICVAYVQSLLNNLTTEEDDGFHAYPMPNYSTIVPYEGNPSAVAPTDSLVLTRIEADGPAEIIQKIQTDDIPTLSRRGYYVVNLKSYEADIHAYRYLQAYVVTTYHNSAGATTPFSSSVATPGVVAGASGSGFPGFHKRFDITLGDTSLNNNGLIEDTIIRLPSSGLYEFHVTAVASLRLDSAMSPGATIDVGYDGSLAFWYAWLTLRRSQFFIQLIPLNDDGTEEYPILGGSVSTNVWPYHPTFAGSLTSSGGPLLDWQQIVASGSSPGIGAGYGGATTTNGHFASSFRVYVYSDKKVGLIVRHDGLSVIPNSNLEVYGQLFCRKAKFDLFLPPHPVYIVGTPDSPTSYAYGLNSTGTGTLPGITISSYAWKVWGPNGTTWTSTGSSYSDTFSDGAGEYVARLLVTYSDNSTGAAEHRFTLPNA